MKKLNAQLLDISRSINPYDDVAEEMADSIIEDIRLAFIHPAVSNSFDKIELIGKFCTAVLLKKYAMGGMTQDQEYNFLRSFAEKKTSSPLQRIDQHTAMDIREMIVQVVNENPESFNRAMEYAEQKRKEIIAKHRLDNQLRLQNRQTEVININEPEEVRLLRQGSPLDK